VPDDVASCFEDPDGIRLEVTNHRRERRERHDLPDSLPEEQDRADGALHMPDAGA
jgi:hypothetical protein